MIPNDILNYRVVRLLGSGGMGSVYLAVNTSIDQQVAIKVLRPEMARSAALRAMFKKEAQLLSSLDHPGIVKFLNYVETPDGVFLIMEYVKGITLEDYILKKNGLIVEKRAYPLIKELLDAFDYAHSKGIVHRDIKPSNIIIQDDGHIKVMDFGIAQIVSQAGAIESGLTMGTPSYMSPEQVYGKPVDNRSDIYSIGVLIHTMLTGRAPYDTTVLTMQQISRLVAKEQLPRMADFYPYVSAGIQAVVDRATRKVPETRYATCREMAVAVRKAINPEPLSKPLLYGGVAVLLTLVLGGFFTWDYFRTKVEYYRDYAELRGVPQGIGRLSNSEMRHREASYRFEYCRHKLRRVSYVNSRGKLVDHHDSETIDRIIDMTLSYTEGTGNVDAVKMMDRNGKVLYVKDYDSNFKTCTFKLDDELGTEMTLNAQVNLFQSAFDASLTEGKSKISKYILTYDDNGYLIREEYAGFGSVRVADGQGLFGRSYVRDKQGRVIEEHYLGKDGKPKATKFGLGIKKFQYDDDDNLVHISYLTIDGKPSSDGNNCPCVQLAYDEWGNRISEKYTDTAQHLMVRKDGTFAGLVYTYNEQGDCVKQQFIGVDGNLAYSNGVNGTVMEYDDNGYLSRKSFIDTKGRPAYYADNDEEIVYARLDMRNDERGNRLEIKVLDANGNLVETARCARYAYTYDSLGNETSICCLDADGNAFVPASLGYAGYTASYNVQGRFERLTYFNAERQPMCKVGTRVCSMQLTYDARGNVVRYEYFDDKDKRSLNEEGVAIVSIEYDDNGNETARSFAGTDEKPCELIGSCARIEYAYDEQGNCTAQRYFNTAGKPMLVGGMASLELQYDARGNITLRRPLDTAGHIAAGQFEEHLVYDSSDNVTERSYFAAGAKPTLCADGYHKCKMQYNSNNLCVQEAYYNTTGKLLNVKDQNYAVIKREFDERGNKITETFFTAQGTRGCDRLKVHKYFNQFDEVLNKVNHQISFGIDGKPIVASNVAPEGRLRYDGRGNPIAVSCFDGYGKPINGKRGWHEQRTTYTEAADVATESYFSLDGKPVADTDQKFHKVAYSYNDQRLLIAETYYAANGRPQLLKAGYSTVKYKYNAKNERTEYAYFGTAGQRVNNQAGWHREVYVYRQGEPFQCTMYDAAGRKLFTATRHNGQWSVPGAGQAPGSTPVWRQVWAELSRSCPYKVADGIMIENVNLASDRISISICLPNFATDELSSDQFNALSQIPYYLRQISSTPSYVTIVLQVYDKYHNKVGTF